MTTSGLLHKPAGVGLVPRGACEKSAMQATRAVRAPSGFGGRAAAVGDVVILEVSGESPAGRAGSAFPAGLVLLYLPRTGAWRLTRPGGRGVAVTVPAGSFAVWPAGPPPSLEGDAGTAGTVLGLPAAAVAVPGGQVVTGPACSAEARLLIAHARALSDTAGGLSPAGTAIARDTLVQLARAVLSQQPGGTAPGLARAAMAAAEARLADPDLSPVLLAGHLHVSVRTLHRAFAAAGEPVGAYIRRRRLEQARADLAAAPGRADVADIAARWQFADSSHLSRVFKKHYGDTPARFARSA